VTKAVPIDRSKTPKPAERAKLVDEYGALQASLVPKVARLKELIEQFRDWAEAEKKACEAALFEGHRYAVPVTERAKKRKIKSLQKLFDLLGQQVFLDACSMRIDTAEKHLKPAERTRMIEDLGNVGVRTVEDAILRPTSTRKAAA
jgi:hypothetical protein